MYLNILEIRTSICYYCKKGKGSGFMTKLLKVVVIPNFTVLAVLALLPALLITSDVGFINGLIDQLFIEHNQ